VLAKEVIKHKIGGLLSILAITNCWDVGGEITIGIMKTKGDP